MLVLTRKAKEKIRIGNGIVISIEGINDKRVRIGIEAPVEIPIRRSESCICCGRPSFEYYLDYQDLPFCGDKRCAKHIKETNKSLFD